MNTRRIKVSVTKGDIAKGKRDYPRLCPIARAMKRLGFKRVAVYQGFVQWPFRRTSPAMLRADLTSTALRFLNDFDCKHPVKPFSFYLRVPIS